MRSPHSPAWSALVGDPPPSHRRRALGLGLMVTFSCLAATVGAAHAAVVQRPRDASASPLTWSQIPEAVPSPREFASMAFMSDRGIDILFGGAAEPDTGNNWCSICMLENVQGDTWSWNGWKWRLVHPSVSPPPREGAVMDYDAMHHQVVLFGGVQVPSTGTNAGAQNSYRFLNDTWSFDGSTWTQHRQARSPGARAGAVMVYDAAIQRMVLFGGTNSAQQWAGHFQDSGPTASSGQALSDTWLWNGSTWTASHGAVGPAARQLASATYDAARGQVVLFGGLRPDETTFNDTWVFNGKGWVRRSPSKSPPARYGSALIFDKATGVSVLVGGGNDVGSNGLPGFWLWNGASWTEGAPPPAAMVQGNLDGSAIGRTPAGRPLVFGGLSIGSARFAIPENDMWTWGGGAWSQTFLSWPDRSGGPDSETGHAFAPYFAMAYDSARRADVLFESPFSEVVGPQDPYATQTYTWDGSQWIHHNAALSPPSQANCNCLLPPPTMAYDAATQSVVLVLPGSSTTAPARTWRWNGTGWTEQQVAASLLAGWGSVVAADPTTGTLVLFGYDIAASSSTNVACGTWIWRGSTWTQLHPQSSPPCRSYEGLSWDPVGKKVVLFGGQPDVPGTWPPAAGPDLNDTWTWDGTNWSLLATTVAPPARELAGMAVDSKTQTLILSGGLPCTAALLACDASPSQCESNQTQNVQAFGDAWAFTASGWQPINLPSLNGPVPRYASATAAGPAGGIDVFGGSEVCTPLPVRDMWVLRAS